MNVSGFDDPNLFRLADVSLAGATRSRRVDNTVQLHTKGIRGVLPRVIEAAEEGGFSVTDLSVAEPSLETVFISLTGKALRD